MADFVGAVMKHVGDQVIGEITGEAPGLSYAKGLLDTVTKEYERAREARTSAQLRDFLVRFTGVLTDAMNDLGTGVRRDYKQMVETAYSKGAGPERTEAVPERRSRITSTRWIGDLRTNVNNVFQLICQEWIRKHDVLGKSAGVNGTPATEGEPSLRR